MDIATIGTEVLRYMPRNGLAFTIRVWGEVDVVLALRSALQFGNDLLLAVQHLILRLEVVVDIDAELALRQVHDVSHRRLHLKVLPQILLQGARFGGGFDDDEILCHRHYDRGSGPTGHAATKYLPPSCCTAPFNSKVSSVCKTRGAGRPLRVMIASMCIVSCRIHARMVASSPCSSIAPVAAPRLSSCGASSSNTSSTRSVNFAPSRIRRWVPRVRSPTAPGTANTSRPCSAA